MRNLIVIIVICVGLMLVGLVTKYSAQPSNVTDITAPRLHEMVNNFAFQSMDGQKYALYDFKGRPVIIHFWATWCAPCVVEFPELIGFAHHNKDAVILAISADTNTDKINRFLKKYVPNMPSNMIIIHDGLNNKIQHQFGTYQLPETYILKQDMVLREKIIGAYKNWETFQFLP